MARAAVFDFDGTLVDSYSRRDRAHRAVRDRLAAYLDERGVDRDETALLSAIETAEATAGEEGDYDRDDWWARMLREHGVDPPADLLADLTREYWELTIEETSVYPSVEDMLERLREEVPTGIVSDTDGLAGMKDRRIDVTGLDAYADAIVVAGEDTAATKPAAEPFDRIADLLGVPPEECVFVGDNPTADVTGGNRTGMTTVLAVDEESYFADDEADPDHTVPAGDVDELERLLRDLLESK